MNAVEKQQQDLEDRRYKATYCITKTIIDAITQIDPYPAYGVARELLQEWCDDEDGDLAITRLVSLIVH